MDSVVSIEPNEKVLKVLNTWINPTPETGVISSSSQSISAEYRLSLTMSCCVSGFRIVHLSNGEIRAEFLVVFCCGSKTITMWKTFQEFQQLAIVIEHLHHGYSSLFNDTLRTWKKVSSYCKWYRCLRAKYLMEMTSALGSFIQNMFHESPSPELLTVFLKTKNFHSGWIQCIIDLM
jgi:hypothetical protein